MDSSRGRRDKLFEEIFDKYSKELYYYALGVIQNKHDAEDILQEAFTIFWKNSKKVTDPKAFLKHVIRNLSINKLKSEKALKQREQRYSALEEQTDIDIEELSNKADKIKIAIEKLPKKCQKIFLMSTIHEMKYSEIADEMIISVNTVKSQLKIARKKIRDRFSSREKLALVKSTPKAPKGY